MLALLGVYFRLGIERALKIFLRLSQFPDVASLQTLTMQSRALVPALAAAVLLAVVAVSVHYSGNSPVSLMGE